MIITANNTLLGIRLDGRRPALPAPLPDFGDAAELEVERQAHAVTAQLLEQARGELARLRAVLSGVTAALSDYEEYLVEVGRD